MNQSLLFMICLFPLVGAVYGQKTPYPPQDSEKANTESTLENLPPWVASIYHQVVDTSLYQLHTNMNPYYLRGDFDGTGRVEVAVWVKNMENGKVGIMVFHRDIDAPFIIGAGNLNYEIDDFWWAGVWRVEEINTVINENDGESLWIKKIEGHSMTLFWSEGDYHIKWD